MVVTEGWAPNVERARRILSPRGVQVGAVEQGQPLPFADSSFELVTSRHPVTPNWGEIARVLVDGGTYLSQHVGPASAFELIEHFVGPMSAQQRLAHDPQVEAAAAQAAGLQIRDLRTARCRMEFLDIGAIVYILRKCVRWVSDFTVERYRDGSATSTGTSASTARSWRIRPAPCSTQDSNSPKTASHRRPDQASALGDGACPISPGSGRPARSVDEGQRRSAW